MRTKDFVIVIALCATLWGCSHTMESMPEDLIGVWRTADKKYADRFFELDADRVVFSTGGWGVTAHPIDRIEEHREDGKILYIIYYPSEEGDESLFSFYYDPTQSVIRFKNQEQFEWVKWVEGPLHRQELEGDQPTLLETPETPPETPETLPETPETPLDPD